MIATCDSDSVAEANGSLMYVAVVGKKRHISEINRVVQTFRVSIPEVVSGD